MNLALVLIPVASGMLVFVLRNAMLRHWILVLTAVAHSALTGWAWWRRPLIDPEAWLALDAPGLLFLSITSALFLAAAFYAVGYLRREQPHVHSDFEAGLLFTNEPEATFTGCLLLFLGAMTLVTLSRHLVLLWVAVEATTLTSAPLIYYHRHHRSLEAVWKYLLVCSVGIALALLGNLFLGVAASGAGPGGGPLSLLLDELIAAAPSLQSSWLRAAFIVSLVGYGTKMGLAPMHTWLPDAHSESPSVVSGLLSGAVLNCAFLGILRIFQVCHAAGQTAFAQDLLLLLGLLSMGTAAVFVLGQTDYKRLLAYSSVEHMGILAVGIGVGGVGIFGSVWHAINHSLTKAMLFLVAGNILTVYQTKSVHQVRGVMRTSPWTGALWMVGFLAITAAPPLAPFFSEFAILKATFDQRREWVGALFLILLAVIFIGMATVFLHTAQGPRSETAVPARLRYRLWAQIPPSALALLVLALGLHLPDKLRALLEEVARALGGA